MNKTITIIVPTYNMEKYLHNCLSSLVISDSYLKYLEVIVVNDGSKDNSSSIAHQFETNYPEVFRVIDKSNGNYGSCVNCGLSEAQGRYVKILDADDSFDTKAFEKFVCYLNHCSSDLVITDFERVDESGAIISNKTFLFVKTDFTFAELDVHEIIEMHAMTIKKDVLMKMNYRQTEGISYTDNEWSILPLFNITTIHYFNKSVYLYLVGRQGQTVDKTNLIKNRQQFFTVAKNVITNIPESILNDLNENYFSHRMCHLLSVIYHAILVDGKCEYQKELADFDLYLQNVYPRVYNDLNKLLTNRFFLYVKIWREKNRKGLSTIFGLYYRLACTVKSIKFL